MINPFDPNQQNPWSVGYNGMAGGYSEYPQQVRVTKKDLVDYIAGNLNASEVVKVDEFETRMTRHICLIFNYCKVTFLMFLPLME